mmetsp:Transcript_52/g.107  ORF Transcript_52/g.107 Transcript_52/m.107 type:complete len:424 (-) Transcript_52:926-2197(-)
MASAHGVLWVAVEFVHSTEVLAPQGETEVMEFIGVGRRGVGRRRTLVANNSNFCITISSQRSVINVSRSNKNKLIINNNHLGVNIDGMATILDGSVLLSDNTLRRFLSVVDTHEHQVVLDGPFGNVVGLQGIENAFVHHADSQELPSQHCLHSNRIRETLREHRNNNVGSKVLLGDNLGDNLLDNENGDQISQSRVNLGIPEVRGTHEILVLNVDETLGSANTENVGVVNGTNHIGISFTLGFNGVAINRSQKLAVPASGSGNLSTSNTLQCSNRGNRLLANFAATSSLNHLPSLSEVLIHINSNGTFQSGVDIMPRLTRTHLCGSPRNTSRVEIILVIVIQRRKDTMLRGIPSTIGHIQTTNVSMNISGGSIADDGLLVMRHHGLFKTLVTITVKSTAGHLGVFEEGPGFFIKSAHQTTSHW